MENEEKTINVLLLGNVNKRPKKRSSVQQREQIIDIRVNSCIDMKSRTLRHSYLQSQNPWYCPILVVMFQSRLLTYHRAYRFSASLLHPTYLPIVLNHPS